MNSVILSRQRKNRNGYWSYSIFMRFLLFILMVGTMPVYADSGPLSGQGSAGDALRQPQIIVRPSSSGHVEEFRRGGQLYMVKITPEKGLSYYLVDTDGDGRLETRRTELDSDFVIPQWILKRWR